MTPSPDDFDPRIDINALSQEIRRVDGQNALGAAALAEALAPFLGSNGHMPKEARTPFGWFIEGKTTSIFIQSQQRPQLQHINGADEVVAMMALQPLPQPLASGLDRLRLLERQELYEKAGGVKPAPKGDKSHENFEHKALAALLYYKTSCSGNEPSLSVFHRMLDEALSVAPALSVFYPMLDEALPVAPSDQVPPEAGTQAGPDTA